MPQPGQSTTSEDGATVELALGDPPRRLPDQIPELRDQLPGLEPERRVTDWGRSERVEGIVDRTVYEFLYRYWFRVDVEGVENVPAEGPALLVANHSGALPSDAAMIAKAIREEHRRPRAVQLATEQQLGRVPGLGMLFTKLGAIAAHPANIHRLLFDEGQLVLQFPEGLGGVGKSLKERYRLRAFDRSDFVQSALSAGAPIVPVAVVGAEEAMPVFGQLSALRRLTRLPRLPLTPALPLPAKFRLRFLEPVATDQLGEGAPGDRRAASGLAEDIRALIQENLFEMVAERRSVWLG
jgi:1-acyl-sn-glycerol-3-phosphate acyltransferase